MRVKTVFLNLFVASLFCLPLAGAQNAQGQAVQSQAVQGQAVQGQAVQGQAVPAVTVHNTAYVMINSISGVDTTIYYTCDSLQDGMRGLLKKLGATHISVFCSGAAGDPETPTFSPTLSLKFDSVRASNNNEVVGTANGATAAWQNMVLKDFSGCEAMRQLFKGVEKYFDIRNLSGDRECMNPEQSYQYSFSILMPQ